MGNRHAVRAAQHSTKLSMGRRVQNVRKILRFGFSFIHGWPKEEFKIVCFCILVVKAQGFDIIADLVELKMSCQSTLLGVSSKTQLDKGQVGWATRAKDVEFLCQTNISCQQRNPLR